MRYMDNQESPPLFDRWVSLFILAAVLERKVYLQWERPIYCNLFLSLVAPPGGKKGTAMNPGVPLIRRLGTRIAANSITREALIRDLKNASENFTAVDNQIHSYAALTVYSKELTVFLGYQNMTLMSDLADWYDCDDEWQYKTKHQGDDIVKKVWVNLIGATTPDLLQAAMPSLSFGSGLNSRFIYVYADKEDREISVFPFETIEEVQLRESLYSDLEKIHMLSGEFTKDQSYLDEWEKWYPVWAQHSHDVGKQQTQIAKDIKMTGYVERRATHIHKVACLMSVSRSSDLVITGEDFKRALSLLQQTEVKMLKTFEGIGKSSLAGVMAQLLNYVRIRQIVPYSEVARQFGYDADPRGLSSMISTLENQRVIECKRVDFGGDKKEFALEYIGDK
jgi:hypothetical protein